MSELVVGSIAGLASNNYVVDIASGSQLTQPGMVLQVVQARKTDVFSTTSTSYVDVTGFTASITPSSTSSKILVRVNAAFTNEGGTGKLRLLRDATPIGNHDSQDYFVRSNPSANATTTNFTRIEGGGFLEILDSPSTDSAVTYKIQALAESDTTNINDTRTSGYYSVSSITLMEIAG